MEVGFLYQSIQNIILGLRVSQRLTDFQTYLSLLQVSIDLFKEARVLKCDGDLSRQSGKDVQVSLGEVVGLVVLHVEDTQHLPTRD